MLFAVIWMDLEIIILNEVSHRKTNIIWYHLYVESFRFFLNFFKMIQMNLFTKQKESPDIENKFMVSKKGRERGINKEFGISKVIYKYM